MRIALVAHTVNRQLGAPRCVAELVARFSMEHDVTVFAGSVADLAGYRFRFVRIPILSVSRFISHASFLVLGAIAMRLHHAVRAADFEIIHSTVGPGLFANVMTWHFCQEAEWRLIKKGVFPTPNGLSRLRALDYGLYRRFMRKGERRAFGKKGPPGLIVISEQMRRDLLQCYGNCGRNIFVIPNAVDAEEFHPRNRDSFREPARKLHSISLETPLILFVGGDWERKGLSVVIASLARMRRKDAMLLVVGSGSVSQYARLAQSGGFADRVIFAGATSNVAQYYAAADVLALPSLYEPFGLVVPEAMASGLPVVISANVGASFFITDEVDGYILENPLDEYALAEKLDTLLDDVALRRRVGEKARLTAEKLSWDNVAHETMKVYTHVLNMRASLNERNDA